MDITLPSASPLTIATIQLERAWRMAKGLHLLKARLQAVHYRMISADRLPVPPVTAREWVDDLSAIVRAGGIPAEVEQALIAVVQRLREL